jgi:Reverse transcriptase (RNA-dependent DNA polymerase)
VDSHYKLAIRNIAKFGDTDIFPFPIENAIFHDKPDRVLSLLQAIGADFGGHVDKFPPVNLTSLAPAGYSGFRWATQLDPLWNAYLLALVISYAAAAEAARIPKEEATIFSYRYAPNFEDGSLFDLSVSWPQFKTQSVGLAEKYPYVLVCDIADFYQRIYHHRIDNALRHIDDGSHKHKEVMSLLSQFSNNVSYGLPIGGPAARLLAELLLNNTDRLLRSAGLTFVRFVDDYHFFAGSNDTSDPPPWLGAGLAGIH